MAHLVNHMRQVLADKRHIFDFWQNFRNLSKIFFSHRRSYAQCKQIQHPPKYTTPPIQQGTTPLRGVLYPIQQGGVVFVYTVSGGIKEYIIDLRVPVPPEKTKKRVFWRKKARFAAAAAATASRKQQTTIGNQSSSSSSITRCSSSRKIQGQEQAG